MDRSSLINLAYLVAAVLFIVGLKGLTHPRTAVRGNLTGAVGMLIAVAATLLDRQILGYGMIFAGMLLGGAIGAVLALKVRMTAMPQMVALLNGFGGAASVLVAGAEIMRRVGGAEAAAGCTVPRAVAVAAVASGLIGAVTFWGSLVAYAKLQEYRLLRKPIHFRGQQTLNAALGAVVVLLGIWGAWEPQNLLVYWALVTVASVLGVTLVVPIGGADMPVVIAVLNSYSGLAGAATGFVLNNAVLVISGSLVGASGLILSQLMCRAMNRSLIQVVFGVFGSADRALAAEAVYGGRVKAAAAEEIAMLFESARRVVVVPGYGMAVAQAQHAVKELADALEARGVEVEFAIHPVAGRMPGHMNVLLAEADVPYDQLKEMDQINPTFAQTDVALVIGANDVVNPLARTDPNSPIAGMPILEVDKARTVVVVKRSLSPGFAGIPNPLFAADNTLMYFGDGKEAILALVAAMRA